MQVKEIAKRFDKITHKNERTEILLTALAKDIEYIAIAMGASETNEHIRDVVDNIVYVANETTETALNSMRQ